MPEDDAMDLNDEGVRLAEEAVRKAQTDHWRTHKSVAEAAITAYWPFYLRAVPESDELVRLRALLDEASRSSHQNGQLFTKGAMHPGSWERCEAMSCSDARVALSPDEAAGDE